jgi:polysaccharide export outer membrane protein
MALVSVTILAFVGCASPEYAFSDGPQPPSAATNAPVVIPPAMLSASGGGMTAELDRLRVGNKITIIFSGFPNSPPKHEEQIREDGNISPPLLPSPVRAADKTRGDLQKELQALYVPDYFKSATITVSREEAFYYVGGEVKTPGAKAFLPGLTVIPAIQSAGDFTDFGKRTKVQITRANGTKETVNCSKILKNPKLDRPIYPGDSIYVPRRLW